MSDPTYDCIIIGGGASGLFAASMLMELTSCRADVLVIDGNDRCGKKLALTGSGRCNLSNRNASADKYRTDDSILLERCLGNFGYEDAVSFFEDTLGVSTVCDNGLFYPSTYRAQTVIDSFRFYLQETGCNMKLGAVCVSIEECNGNFRVSLKDGSSYISRNIIFAAGGSTYPSTGTDGSAVKLLSRMVDSKDIVSFRPALTSLSSKMQGIKALAGIRCKGSVRLLAGGKETADHSEGEVIFSKEGGISGICVMDISGTAVSLMDKGVRPVVSVNLIGRTEEETFEMLLSRRDRFVSRNVTAALTGLMPRVLCEFVCKNAGIDPDGKICNVDDKALKTLTSSICGLRIPVDGFGGNDKAQVSSGGVRLSAMNEDMQYKGKKGLYITGEALNVDGRCGGFNLQWAWSSAAAAARGVAADV